MSNTSTIVPPADLLESLIQRHSMLSRIPSLVVLAATMVALAGLPLRAADDKAHEATVVKAGDGKITLDDKKAKQKAKLEDLKEGYHVKVVMDDKHVLHRIDAHTAAAGE